MVARVIRPALRLVDPLPRRVSVWPLVFGAALALAVIGAWLTFWKALDLALLAWKAAWP
jgi:hypothetical protein